MRVGEVGERERMSLDNTKRKEWAGLHCARPFSFVWDLDRKPKTSPSFVWSGDSPSQVEERARALLARAQTSAEASASSGVGGAGGEAAAEAAVLLQSARHIALQVRRCWGTRSLRFPSRERARALSPAAPVLTLAAPPRAVPCPTPQLEWSAAHAAAEVKRRATVAAKKAADDAAAAATGKGKGKAKASGPAAGAGSDPSLSDDAEAIKRVWDAARWLRFNVEVRGDCAAGTRGRTPRLLSC